MDGMRKALIAQGNLIRRAQAILARYLKPRGPSASTTVNELFDTLDGPDAREAERLEREALHRDAGKRSSAA